MPPQKVINLSTIVLMVAATVAMGWAIIHMGGFAMPGPRVHPYVIALVLWNVSSFVPIGMLAGLQLLTRPGVAMALVLLAAACVNTGIGACVTLDKTGMLMMFAPIVQWAITAAVGLGVIILGAFAEE